MGSVRQLIRRSTGKDPGILSRPPLLRILWVLAVFAGGSTLASEPSHGFAYFGEPKYPKDMDHYDYVNPDAPKGGTARVAAIGTFNNLNPFVDKGILAQYIDPRVFTITHERLMTESEDELATYYGRLAGDHRGR